MKNFAKNLLVVSAPLLLLMADAAAESCGFGRFPPCQVPEPGTPYLFLGAIGVAGLILKFRKK